MPLAIDYQLTPKNLERQIERLFDLSAEKISALEKNWDPSRGTPVFTVKGRYTSRGWTEWTQGFQFGSALLQFEATGEERFLEHGRESTFRWMAPHLSHMGVHDHGFNNISTYGNLLRLMLEKKIPFNDRERDFYELALKISGAVQAARWTSITGGAGYIYSFNGPHSLFIDTMRSLRSLAAAHLLGHALMAEHDRKVSLLGRLLDHAETTARFAVYYGEGRDAYDLRGRTAHESIFNLNDGQYRCPNSQQGYSPFTTWTRGLAWAILGFAEQLEFLQFLHHPAGRGTSRNSKANKTNRTGSREKESSRDSQKLFLKAALATADFYLDHCCRDGIPMWDTGAPNLFRLGDYLEKPADPFNPWEPVDSSAAAIAAQGLLRLGQFLSGTRQAKASRRYRQAGLTISRTLFDEPYLAGNPKHQGLILHSIYHRPNGWDYTAPNQRIPNGESSLWGDYQARELALMILREIRGEEPLTFFLGLERTLKENLPSHFPDQTRPAHPHPAQRSKP